MDTKPEQGTEETEGVDKHWFAIASTGNFCKQEADRLEAQAEPGYELAIKVLRETARRLASDAPQALPHLHAVSAWCDKRARELKEEVGGPLAAGFLGQVALRLRESTGPRAHPFESVEARQARRLQRFRELGGDVVKTGAGWVKRSKRGALSALVVNRQEVVS